jgi:hypothetical protein
MASDVFSMAANVLPALPWDVRAIRDDGGMIGMRVLAAGDGRLECTLSGHEAHVGLQLTLPVESPERGGFSIDCRIEQIIAIGRQELEAELEVLGVTRRKPHRTAQRGDARAGAAIFVVCAANHGLGTELRGEVVDVSAGGIGLATSAPVQPGDRLRVETVYDGIGIRGEVQVVAVDRGAAGTWRAACRFTRLPLETAHELAGRGPQRAA